MFPDPDLDALLRDVPVPEELVARLQASLGPGDEDLDAALRQVVIPVGMLRDLHAIPDDERVDQQLRDIAVSFRVVHQLRRSSWKGRVRALVFRATELAAALALFVCVSAALFGAVAVFIGSTYPHAIPQGEPAFIIAENLPLTIESSQTDERERAVDYSITLSAPRLGEAAPLSTAGSEFAVDAPDISSASVGGPVDQWLASLHQGVRPLENAVLLRFGIFGYPQREEEVAPPLEWPPEPNVAGIELPAVRGYDRSFALRHGVFPPVNPAAHPALAAITLPLQTHSPSYEHVRWLLQKQRFPMPLAVRTEDFLAAMNYQFSATPAGELSIRTAAGPSVFGPRGTGLLQVAAMAGPLARDVGDGGHLVLAIDMSQTMARGQRLEFVRHSIEHVLGRLGPRDRLSLVVFDEAVRYIVERMGNADSDQVRKLLAELRPAGATDLAEGIQQAAVLAMTTEPEQSRPSHLVLITDSHVAMPVETQSLVAAVLSIAEEDGVRMDVLDVGDHPDADERLTEWAAMLHGKVHRPASGADAGWQLVECLYGKPAVVGAEARLTLRFDSQSVAAYRLVGSEGNSLSSLRPASREVDLRDREVAAALLEIWFHPNDIDRVGTVELSWRDPATGREQRRSQQVSRLQFAPTWEQSPISLQQAAIAAETAEVLRGSRTALRQKGLVPPGASDMAAVRAAAKRVHPRLAERSEFQEWMQMVEDLSNLRP